MTSNTPASPEPTESLPARTSTDPQTPWPEPEIDPLFAEVVRMANRIGNFQLPVTLVVNGALITGRLVGITAFFRRYGAQWSKLLGSAGGSTLKQHYDALAASVDEDIRTEGETAIPHFVHLVDARFVEAAGVYPDDEQGMLWRGKTRDVTGFTLTLLSTKKK